MPTPLQPLDESMSFESDGGTKEHETRDEDNRVPSYVTRRKIANLSVTNKTTNAMQAELQSYNPDTDEVEKVYPVRRESQGSQFLGHENDAGAFFTVRSGNVLRAKSNTESTICFSVVDVR